ncbi:hypothetical protein ST37_13990 [Vibrio sp. qd031]|nr:hypothetical protein ST37_13990 [Vibrio sp. qd031]
MGKFRQKINGNGLLVSLLGSESNGPRVQLGVPNEKLTLTPIGKIDHFDSDPNKPLTLTPTKKALLGSAFYITR